MVQDTKLTFSDEEMDAMQNSRFFLVKNDVTQKVTSLFGELEKELMKSVSNFPFLASAEWQIKEKGKIFRGENYRMMPYMILDCPRVFNTEKVFAFRSMFRWGHEFSFTLHLQGQALEVSREKIRQHISDLNRLQYYVCVNDTPWEYTFDENNYVLLDEMMENRSEELQEIINTGNFLKLSRKMDLEHFSNAVSYGVETFERVMKVLQ